MTYQIKDPADAALTVAIELFSHNYPDEKVTTALKGRLRSKIHELIDAGMTDKDLLASFSINRVRHNLR